MSTFFRSQDDSLKRNKSLTRIDRVRCFLGKKGKTQSLISFFDQTTSTEKVSSYQYTKRSSQIVNQKEEPRSSIFKNRRTQSQHLEKKDIANVFGIRSPSLYGSRLVISSKGLPLGSKKTDRLYTPPSMSFPAHLRSQSQAAVSVLGHGTLSSSPTGISQPFSVQPWWEAPDTESSEGSPKQDNITVDATPSFILTAHSNSIHAIGEISQDEMGSRCPLPSRSSSCLLPLLDSLNPCFEISICSDSSYATCPTPFLDEESSEGGSTPTLLSDSPVMPSTVKDECQSPLASSYVFPKPTFDHSVDNSVSIADWTEQTEGLAIENIDANVSRFIQTDQPGRQDRLRQYTSKESLKQPPSVGTSIVSGKYVKQQLSLTDFLHELRKMPTEAEEQVGDVSLTSSVMNEEEVDSVQICRAWRQSIAFANLGASHKNKSLQEDHMESPTSTSIVTINRPVSRKQSRVSLRSIPLDTIEEITNKTVHSDLEMLAMTSSQDGSDDHIDICAHLLQRAKEDLMTST